MWRQGEAAALLTASHWWCVASQVGLVKRLPWGSLVRADAPVPASHLRMCLTQR